MNENQLQALASGQLMGTATYQPRSNQLSFAYAPAWREARGAYPLSLSMPLGAEEFGDKPVRAFLTGLLPDNAAVLERWGELHHVSPHNAFRLLQYVGEDCAGAVQFVPPSRAEEILAKGEASGGVDWLTESELSERLRLLLLDHSATRKGNDRGQFSLAGAQPKTGLYYDTAQQRWGVPYGAVPTTHIFKPATGDFDGYTENEHFCLRLAARLGMRVGESTVQTFGNPPVIAIVLKRYDRLRSAGGNVRRVHQEDFCQALGRLPRMKYQNDGGPSAEEVVRLIREYSSAPRDDEERFLDALIFNWLIAGTDGHGKNFSLLLSGGGQARLAPLYDLGSALPYFPTQVDPRRARLAMKVGGQYRWREIAGREWAKLATLWKVDEDWVRGRIARMAAALPDAAVATGRELADAGLAHPVIGRLVESLRAVKGLE